MVSIGAAGPAAAEDFLNFLPPVTATGALVTDTGARVTGSGSVVPKNCTAFPTSTVCGREGGWAEIHVVFTHR